MDEPFPRGWGTILPDLYIVLLHLLLEDLAVLVLAQPEGKTGLIRGLLANQSIDYNWACEVDKSFAGGPHGTIEELAKLFVYEICC